MDKIQKIRKKVKLSTIINILVIVISVSTVTYFFISDDGFFQLLNSGQTFIIGWILMAVFAHLFNLFIDSLTVLEFLKIKYKKITFWESIKISMVGQFFSAITPSATGGQPMQIYLMSKMNIEPGFATSVTVQKLIVYQIVATVFSIVAIIFRIDYFIANLSNPAMWIFTLIGFSSQLIFTTFVFLIAFNKKVANLFVRFASFLIRKIKFIKKKDKLIENIKEQVDMFYSSNKNILKAPKTMIRVYILVFLQVTALLSIPYFIYRAFGYNDASLIDIICSQAYVNLSVSMIPLPGASGAAEVGFAAFFSMYFAPETLKSAILVWRVITYYGTIIISAPFSRFTSDKKQKESKKEDNNDNDIDNIEIS